MLINFKNVEKNYKSSNFNLTNINFSLSSKEVLGIIGKNGTGKSTILKMTNALVKPDSGVIEYMGRDINKMSAEELRKLRKEVVYIFQNANLLDNKTVYYHLSLVYKLNKEKVDEEKIDEILDFMEIKRLKNSYTRHLSGGQKQKVAIAMAILQKPKLILCDEISSGLDSNAEKEIFNLLVKTIKKFDLSILIVSHNLNILKNFCDRILFIEDNTIKDIIVPKKSSETFEEDYYKNVLEYMHA